MMFYLISLNSLLLNTSRSLNLSYGKVKEYSRYPSSMYYDA